MKPAAMTLAALRATLDRAVQVDSAAQRLAVVVCYESLTATVGALPYAPMVGAAPGIDWDAGRLLLTTSPSLGPGLDERAKSERRRDTLGRFVGWDLPHVLNSQASDAQKIAQIRDQLNTLNIRLRKGAGHDRSAT